MSSYRCCSTTIFLDGDPLDLLHLPVHHLAQSLRSRNLPRSLHPQLDLQKLLQRWARQLQNAGVRGSSRLNSPVSGRLLVSKKPAQVPGLLARMELGRLPPIQSEFRFWSWINRQLLRPTWFKNKGSYSTGLPLSSTRWVQFEKPWHSLVAVVVACGVREPMVQYNRESFIRPVDPRVGLVSNQKKPFCIISFNFPYSSNQTEKLHLLVLKFWLGNETVPI